MCRCVSLWCNNKIMLWWCKSKKFGTVGKYPLELQGVNTPCKQMNPNLSCTRVVPVRSLVVPTTCSTCYMGGTWYQYQVLLGSRELRIVGGNLTAHLFR